jgi:hypothetical protein
LQSDLSRAAGEVKSKSVPAARAVASLRGANAAKQSSTAFGLLRCARNDAGQNVPRRACVRVLLNRRRARHVRAGSDLHQIVAAGGAAHIRPCPARISLRFIRVRKTKEAERRRTRMSNLRASGRGRCPRPDPPRLREREWEGAARLSAFSPKPPGARYVDWLSKIMNIRQLYSMRTADDPAGREIYRYHARSSSMTVKRSLF